jgi:hypothetical protein
MPVVRPLAYSDSTACARVCYRGVACLCVCMCVRVCACVCVCARACGSRAAYTNQPVQLRLPAS